jgi:hypothetical protein
MELPPLPYEQYSALKDNIALRGVLVPILVHDEGRVRRIMTAITESGSPTNSATNARRSSRPGWRKKS